MPSLQKSKGSGFEREIARFLSDLYKESFMRVQNSGAYIGGKNSFRKDSLSESQIRHSKGDIVPGESFPRLNVECKSYKDFPFHQLFLGQVKVLENWINQCMDVSDPGDFNIIFMKFNRKGTFVAAQFTDTDTTSNPQINSLIYKSNHHGNWLIMGQEEFFRLNADKVKLLCM